MWVSTRSRVTATGKYTPTAGVQQDIAYTGSNFNWGYSKNTTTQAMGVGAKLYANWQNFNLSPYVISPQPASPSTAQYTAMEVYPNDYLASQHIYIGPFDDNTQAVVTIKFRASIVRYNRWTGMVATEFAPLPATLASAYSDTDDTPSTKLSFTGTVTAGGGRCHDEPDRAICLRHERDERSARLPPRFGLD